MKTKMQFQFLIMTLAVILVSFNAGIGQCPPFNPAVTIDQCVGLGSSTSCFPIPCGNLVQQCFNTGNDVDKHGTPNLHVMVWEEQANKVFYGWDNAGTKGGPVQISPSSNDPDVILWGKTMLIVYITGGEIRCSGYGFFGGTFSPIIALTNVKLSNTGSASACSNPNVDIAEEGIFSKYAVVTWEQDDHIFANVVNLSALSVVYTGSTAPKIYDGTVDPAVYPDVAVNETGGTQDAFANFVYSYDNSTTSLWTAEVTRCKLAALTGGTGCSGGGTPDKAIKFSSGSFSMGPPRIACPPGPDPVNFSPTDYSVVASKEGGATSEIVSSTHWSGSLSTPITVNNVGGMTTCRNELPAITYSGDHIIIAWMFDYDPTICAQTSLPLSGLDIIARRLTHGGTLSDACNSIVNFCIGGNSTLPSLASNGFSGPIHTFFAFHHDDPVTKSILYKSSLWTNINLKTAEETEVQLFPTADVSGFGTNITINPNPWIDHLDIRLNVLEGERARELLIYSFSGQLIYQKALSTYEQGEHIIDWRSSNIPEGGYLVKLITEKNTRVQKIFKTR
ncbi:MAG: T9SS type A sorting domain-containing protein [Bacteroidetes bacterium]|nr:T9SS type A sorting domain-containing protein [Bacteroidota bacterium]